MDFHHDELLLAIQATAQRVARDQTAAAVTERVAAGRVAAGRAGLLELLSGAGASDGDVDPEADLSRQALGVALHTLALADTGLALFVWAQNVAAGAADGVSAELATSFRSGEPVAVPLDLELGANAGFYVSCGAPRGLAVGPQGWRCAAGEAGARSSVGIDGADVGAFGPQAEGRSLATPDLPSAVSGLAAIAAAVASRASRVACEYALVREQFGHPIADFQAIRFMLADSRTGADAARLLALAAAAREDLAGAARALHMAAAAARAAADVAVQVHGGAGYTRDYPAEALLRDASILQHVARRRFEGCALDPVASLAAVGHV